jgi:hypothetical protein
MHGHSNRRSAKLKFEAIRYRSVLKPTKDGGAESLGRAQRHKARDSFSPPHYQHLSYKC